jgi:curved DNA-binding protein CbpA
MNSSSLEETVQAWLSVLAHLSHYEVLGVPQHASELEIQAAFHLFSERFHPDRHRGESHELRESIGTIFRRGSEAYRVLRQAEPRADYDLYLATSRPRLSGAPGADAELKSLAELCLTPGGRLHARQAARAISDGQLYEAAGLLERALVAEGTNQELEERLEAVRQLAELGRQSEADPPGKDPTT